MRIALKVTSSDENCIGGCKFTLQDLTPELAALAPRQITTLCERKNLDPDIDGTWYPEFLL
jgi:hypothetical protein